MPSGTTASDLSASSISTQADEQGAKFTPGPWTLHEQPYDCRSGEGLDFSIMTDAEPIKVLALIAAAGEPTKQFRADLRVMAAGADMLEALQAVMSEWREGYGLRCEKQVRAAIAKATGATQS